MEGGGGRGLFEWESGGCVDTTLFPMLTPLGSSVIATPAGF